MSVDGRAARRSPDTADVTGKARSGRRATDAEIEHWRTHGYVLLPGLVDAIEIDDALDDLWLQVPTPDEFFSDESARRELLGDPTPARIRPAFSDVPASGPAFRPEQFSARGDFPFPGSGRLNRLCVHANIADFARRALGTRDVRLYQATSMAKYYGVTDYEQPLHTDRNHSLVPVPFGEPWWYLQGFLYLSDVGPENGPTQVVSTTLDARRDRDTAPHEGQHLYDAAMTATAPRGSFLAYGPHTLHRATNIERDDASRFVINLGYRVAGHEWIGFTAIHPRSLWKEWVDLVVSSTPDQLELFGFPPPGHDLWNEASIADLEQRYPGLDTEPWRRAVRPRAERAERTDRRPTERATRTGT